MDVKGYRIHMKLVKLERLLLEADETREEILQLIVGNNKVGRIGRKKKVVNREQVRTKKKKNQQPRKRVGSVGERKRNKKKSNKRKVQRSVSANRQNNGSKKGNKNNKRIITKKDKKRKGRKSK